MGTANEVIKLSKLRNLVVRCEDDQDLHYDLLSVCDGYCVENGKTCYWGEGWSVEVGGEV
jgi:hypothetical protein